MKKALMLLVTLTTLASTASAAQLGGAIGLRQWDFSISAGVGYHVRQLKVDENWNQKADGRSFQFLIKPSVGFHEHFSMHLLLGATDLQTEDLPRDFTGNLGFTYGGGFNVSFLPKREFDYFTIGVAGSALGYNTSETGIKVDVFEYNASLYFAYFLRRASLYGALGWYDSYFWNNDTGRMSYLRADDNYSLVLGVDYYITPEVFLIAEMHNFNEDFIFVGVGYQYTPYTK